MQIQATTSTVNGTMCRVTHETAAMLRQLRESIGLASIDATIRELARAWRESDRTR